jgi:hypothetical protein
VLLASESYEPGAATWEQWILRETSKRYVRLSEYPVYQAKVIIQVDVRGLYHEFYG